jgi:hypothetical protein
MKISRVDSIKNFLLASTHKDLAELYTPDMECQVTVGQDGGHSVDGDYKGRQWQAWSDGVQTWKPFRIPHNAATVPEYDLTTAMSYDLEAHAEGIGMTGWDWKSKLSRWVAFDFDAISGHEKHAKALSNDELQRIQDKVLAIPWVTIRRSTGGKGLHLYVFLDPIETANHTEHAALGRSILGRLGAITGYVFET